MRKINIFRALHFVLLILMLLCCGCASQQRDDAVILDEKFAIFNKMEVIQWRGDAYFYACGLCMHSSYVVRDVQVLKKDNIAIVRIEAIPVTEKLLKKGLTGNFTFDVLLSKNLKKIVLGTETGKVLWERTEKKPEAAPWTVYLKSIEKQAATEAGRE